MAACLLLRYHLSTTVEIAGEFPAGTGASVIAQKNGARSSGATSKYLRLYGLPDDFLNHNCIVPIV